MEYRNNKIKGYKVDYDLIRREENLSYNERIDFRVNALSIERACELFAMAAEDICPDSHYSDFECNVWSAFKRVISSEREHKTMP